MLPVRNMTSEDAAKDVGHLGTDDWDDRAVAEELPIAPPPINIIDFDDYNNHRISGNSSWSRIVSHEIVEEEEDEYFEVDGKGRRVMASINEEYNEIESGRSNWFAINGDIQNAEDVVYVAVWKGSEELSAVSKEALVWTVNHALRDSTIVYLVHVSPEVHYIPTPIGKLPISQANPEQKESYMIQERSKTREYLKKFLDLCSSSKVSVETVLIESDMEAKAILDLIPILNIRKLVLGTSKSALRKMKSSSKRGGNTIEQILHNAPEFCEVKIICEGKEVSVQDQLNIESPSSRLPPAPSPQGVDVTSPRRMQMQDDHVNDFMKCGGCFKPKVVS